MSKIEIKLTKTFEINTDEPSHQDYLENIETQLHADGVRGQASAAEVKLAISRLIEEDIDSVLDLTEINSPDFEIIVPDSHGLSGGEDADEDAEGEGE